jgi:hypothetical protein
MGDVAMMRMLTNPAEVQKRPTRNFARRRSDESREHDARQSVVLDVTAVVNNATKVVTPGNLAGRKVVASKGAPRLSTLRPLSVNTLLTLKRDIDRLFRPPIAFGNDYIFVPSKRQ